MLDLGTLTTRLAIDASWFNRSLTAAESDFLNFVGNISTIGGQLSLGVSVPLMAMGTAAVREFAKFDEAITESVAIIENATPQMRKQFEEAAVAMSMLRPQAPEDMGKAFYYLASAGYTASEAVAALPAVVDFATAGVFKLDVATERLADAQSALGMRMVDPIENMKQMTRVSDVLVKAANISNASVEEFSRSLNKKAGQAIRLASKDITEGVAALSVLADQGIKAENAGESLWMAMRDLQTQAIKHKDVWKQLGVAVYDARGQMLPLHDIIGGLEKLFAGASTEQRRMTLSMLGFTDRSVAPILALTGMSDRMRNYYEILQKAGGETKRVAEEQMKSFSNQVRIAVNELKAMGIEIGQVLLPHLQAAMKWVKGLTEEFRKMSQVEKENAVAWAAWIVALGPVLLAGTAVVALFRNLYLAGMALATPLMAIWGWISGLSAAIGPLGAAIASVVAWFTTANALWLAGTAVIVGFAAAVVAAAVVVGGEFWNWITLASKLNEEMAKGVDLNNQLSHTHRVQQSKVLGKADSMKDPFAKRDYLTAELKKAELNAEGLANAVKNARAELVRFGTADAAQSVKEAEGHAAAGKKRVDELRAALEKMGKAGLRPDAAGKKKGATPMSEDLADTLKQQTMVKALENAEKHARKLREEVEQLRVPENMRSIVEAEQEFKRVLEETGNKGLAQQTKDLIIEKDKLKKKNDEIADQAREEKQRLEEMANEAKRIMDKSDSPLERMINHARRLQEMFNRGMLDGKGVKHALEDAGGLNKKEKDNNPRLSMSYTDDVQKRVLQLQHFGPKKDAAQDMVMLQKAANVLLAKILAKQPVPTVPQKPVGFSG